MDKSVVGMIFGNALTNATSLYAAGVFEFEDPADAEGSAAELVGVAKLIAYAAIDAQDEIADEVGAEERPTRSSSRSSGGRGSSSRRSSGTRSGGKTGVKPENRDKPATPAQKAKIKDLDPDQNTRGLTMQEASDLIQELMEE